jgi:hypothetical protein
MAGSLTPSATGGFAVTPHDSTYFNQKARALYIGGAGTGALTVVPSKDSTATVVFAGVPVGTIIPIECWRVNSTGTGVTNIVALY